MLQFSSQLSSTDFLNSFIEAEIAYRTIRPLQIDRFRDVHKDVELYSHPPVQR